MKNIAICPGSVLSKEQEKTKLIIYALKGEFSLKKIRKFSGSSKAILINADKAQLLLFSINTIYKNKTLRKMDKIIPALYR